MPAIQENYVDQAKKVIEGLGKQVMDRRTNQPITNFDLTTTQLRNLLSLTAQIFDEAEGQSGDTLSARLKDKVQYLRVRFIYQAGRENPVMAFMQQANLMQALNEIGTSREKLLTFCRYMEALVAWKKYLDRNDN